ncbi:MAG: hypothetical protein ACTSO9_20915, partial [Candidatus Helarchaeota archaeon]
EFGIIKQSKKKKKKKTKVSWNIKTQQNFEKMLLTTPKEFRSITKVTIGSLAERKAKKRGSNIVENEDMVQAFLEGTPAPFQAEMRQGLKKLGLKIEE